MHPPPACRALLNLVQPLAGFAARAASSPPHGAEGMLAACVPRSSATWPQTVVSGLQHLASSAMPADIAGPIVDAAVRAVHGSAMAVNLLLTLASPEVAARQARALAAARATSLRGERLLAWFTATVAASHQLCDLHGE